MEALTSLLKLYFILIHLRKEEIWLKIKNCHWPDLQEDFWLYLWLKNLLHTWSRGMDFSCFLNSSRETSLSLPIISFRYFSFDDSGNSIRCSSMYSARSAKTSVWPSFKAISNGVSLLFSVTPRGSTLWQDGKGGCQHQLPTNPCFKRRRTKSCLSLRTASCKSVPCSPTDVCSSWKGKSIKAFWFQVIVLSPICMKWWEGV